MDLDAGERGLDLVEKGSASELAPGGRSMRSPEKGSAGSPGGACRRR